MVKVFHIRMEPDLNVTPTTSYKELLF